MNMDGTVKSRKKITVDAGRLIDQLASGELLTTGNLFGRSLANMGDLVKDGVTDLAVGSPGDDDGGLDRGAIWVLYINKGAEVQDLTTISNTQGIFNGVLNCDDHFGAAIAGIGDLNNRRGVDFSVGAPFDNSGGIDKGAVWILFMDEHDTRTECERSSLLRFLGIGNCQ